MWSQNMSRSLAWSCIPLMCFARRIFCCAREIDFQRRRVAVGGHNSRILRHQKTQNALWFIVAGYVQQPPKWKMRLKMARLQQFWCNCNWKFPRKEDPQAMRCFLLIPSSNLHLVLMIFLRNWERKFENLIGKVVFPTISPTLLSSSKQLSGGWLRLVPISEAVVTQFAGWFHASKKSLEVIPPCNQTWKTWQWPSFSSKIIKPNGWFFNIHLCLPDW